MTAEPATFEIRPARPGDAPELAETAIAAWRIGFRGIVPEHVDPSRAWRPERLEARLAANAATGTDGSEIHAAEVDGTVRGLVLFGPSRDPGAPPREGEIVALYVHPANWRAGIGAALVDSALAALAPVNDSVIVWTLAESPRNLAFYAALGFHRDGGTQRRPSFGSPLEVRFRVDPAIRRSPARR